MGTKLLERGGLQKKIYFTSSYIVSEQEVSLSQARKEYIGIIEELLCRLNHDQKLRPQLKDQPLTYQNIDLVLAFQKPDYSFYSGGSVCLVYKNDHVISYTMEDPEQSKKDG